MAERKMQVRTRSEDNLVEVIVRIEHPMETGLRTDPATKQKIPAHFIQRVDIEHNGKSVATLFAGIAVSKDPLLGFRLKNAKSGDKLKISWADNRGEKGMTETTVKV